MMNDMLNKAFSIKDLRRNHSSNNIAAFVSSWLEKHNSKETQEIRETLNLNGGILRELWEGKK